MEALKGIRTYIAAAASILTGLAGILATTATLVPHDWALKLIGASASLASLAAIFAKWSGLNAAKAVEENLTPPVLTNPPLIRRTP